MENPSLPVKVEQEDVDMEIKEGSNLVVLEIVKHEDVDIKQEDCFEIVNKSHLIHGIKEESVLNNKPNNDGQLKIVRKREIDQIQQTKMFEGVNDEKEVHVIWTKVAGNEPDLLAVDPADKVKVESQTAADARPSFSKDMDELFLCAKSCDRFTSFEEYQEHLKTCSHLQNSTSYINNLLQKADNFTTIENPDKLYKCTVCNFYTSKLWNLKRHMRLHTGEKPYKCTQCEFAASELGNLKEHLNKHKKDHPYKCISCDYATSKPSSLKRHMSLKDHLPFRTRKMPSTLTVTEPKYTAVRPLSLKEQINNAFKRKTLLK